MSLLNPGPTFSVYMVYALLRKLTTPFIETPAYKLGIIDDRGNVLRPRRTLKTEQERQAYTVLDTFVFKLKRLLEQIPGGKSRLASYAAALWLLKESEQEEQEDETISVDEFINYFENFDLDESKEMWEEIMKLFQQPLQLEVGDDIDYKLEEYFLLKDE